MLGRVNTHHDEEVSSPAGDEELGRTALALMMRGVAFLREVNPEKARPCFEEAVLLTPWDAEANFNMGLYHEICHEPDKMVGWMRRTLLINPQHYMALVLCGKYEERIGEFGLAERTYRKALECDRDPHLARGQMDQLAGDHKVSLDPVSAWPRAARDILAESPSWRWQTPRWQENFLHPREDPPRTPSLEYGVCVWDDVVGEPLLSMLTDSVDDMFQFVTTNFWLTPGGSVTTSWLPREKLQPESAPELAIRLLMPRLLGEDGENFCGVEWWARMRTESRGQGLHYDQSEADEPEMPCSICGAQQSSEWVHGNPWRPRWSSILFLTDEGGPTVLLEQIHTRADRNDPRCPQRGFMATPKRGRWLVFRGDLFHGSMPLEHSGIAPRKVIAFNMWRTHRPPGGHCNPVRYNSHPALRKLVLTPEQVAEMSAIESSRHARLVERERFASAAAMPHSSSYGYLPFALPLPQALRLRTGSGFYEFDWRSAAEEHTSIRHGHGLPATMSELPWPRKFEIVD